MILIMWHRPHNLNKKVVVSQFIFQSISVQKQTLFKEKGTQIHNYIISCRSESSNLSLVVLDHYRKAVTDVSDADTFYEAVFVREIDNKLDQKGFSLNY